MQQHAIKTKNVYKNFKNTFLIVWRTGSVSEGVHSGRRRADHGFFVWKKRSCQSTVPFFQKYFLVFFLFCWSSFPIDWHTFLGLHLFPSAGSLLLLVRRSFPWLAYFSFWLAYSSYRLAICLLLVGLFSCGWYSHWWLSGVQSLLIVPTSLNRR